MSAISLNIDGREVKAKGGMTVLEAARSAGIFVPTLCHNEMLEPYGGCRLCIVEAETEGRRSIVASCVHPAEVPTRGTSCTRATPSSVRSTTGYWPTARTC